MINDGFSPSRQGDYYQFCDICGAQYWHSQMVQQDVYTGRGGTWACPNCADPIDYGLVPYKVPSERPIPISRDTIYSGNQTAVNNQTFYLPFDYEEFDPMSTSPAEASQGSSFWNNLKFQTWDNWNIIWEQNGENE